MTTAHSTSGFRPVAAAASGAGASLLPPLPFTGEGWGEGALCAPPSPAGGRGAFCFSASSTSAASDASAASCASITATTPPSDSVSPTLTLRSEEHTSELQSLMRISYAVFCLKKKKQYIKHTPSYS